MIPYTYTKQELDELEQELLELHLEITSDWNYYTDEQLHELAAMETDEDE